MYKSSNNFSILKYIVFLCIVELPMAFYHVYSMVNSE